MALNVAGALAFRVSMAILTIIFGTVGNVLSLIVMLRPSMRKTSTAVYLSALAITDTLVLYTGQIPLLVSYFNGVMLSVLTEGTCKVEYFFLFTFGDVAVWLLLALTVDRFISVQFALKAKDFCTHKRATIVSISVFVIAFVKNLHLLFTRGLVSEQPEVQNTTITTEISTTAPLTVVSCGIVVENAYTFETYIRPWIGFSVYAFIPLTTMFILNILIVGGLLKMKKMRSKPAPAKQNTEIKTVSQQTSAPAKKQSGMSGQITSLTIMFLSVSIMFLILITPSICNIVALPYWVETDEDWNKFTVISSVVDSLVYINHSINFVLYCISGRRFRNEFLGLIGCVRSGDTAWRVTATGQSNA